MPCFPGRRHRTAGGARVAVEAGEQGAGGGQPDGPHAPGAALGWVQEGLQAGGLLREVAVTDVLPRGRPWDRRA